ncbi:MAG: hypothetical protein ACOYKZ_03525 [Chlamydiia bacterium]
MLSKGGRVGYQVALKTSQVGGSVVRGYRHLPGFIQRGIEITAATAVLGPVAGVVVPTVSRVVDALLHANPTQAGREALYGVMTGAVGVGGGEVAGGTATISLIGQAVGEGTKQILDHTLPDYVQTTIKLGGCATVVGAQALKTEFEQLSPTTQALLGTAVGMTVAGPLWGGGLIPLMRFVHAAADDHHEEAVQHGGMAVVQAAAGSLVSAVVSVGVPLAAQAIGNATIQTGITSTASAISTSVGMAADAIGNSIGVITGGPTVAGIVTGGMISGGPTVSGILAGGMIAEESYRMGKRLVQKGKDLAEQAVVAIGRPIVTFNEYRTAYWDHPTKGPAIRELLGKTGPELGAQIIGAIPKAGPIEEILSRQEREATVEELRVKQTEALSRFQDCTALFGAMAAAVFTLKPKAADGAAAPAEASTMDDVLDCFKAAQAGYPRWNSWHEAQRLVLLGHRRDDVALEEDLRVPEGVDLSPAAVKGRCETFMLQMLKEKYQLGWIKRRIAKRMFTVLHLLLEGNLREVGGKLTDMLQKGTSHDGAKKLVEALQLVVHALQGKLHQHENAIGDFARTNQAHAGDAANATENRLSTFLNQILSSDELNGGMSESERQAELTNSLVDLFCPKLLNLSTRCLAFVKSPAGDSVGSRIKYALLVVPASVSFGALWLLEQVLNPLARSLFRSIFKWFGLLTTVREQVVGMLGSPTGTNGAHELSCLAKLPGLGNIGSALLDGLTTAWETAAVTLHEMAEENSVEGPNGVVGIKASLDRLRDKGDVPLVVSDQLTHESREIVSHLLNLSRVNGHESPAEVQAALGDQSESLGRFAENIRTLMDISIDSKIVDGLVMPNMDVILRAILQRILHNERFRLNPVVAVLESVNKMYATDFKDPEPPPVVQDPQPAQANAAAPQVLNASIQKYERAWEAMLQQAGRFVSQLVLQTSDLEKRQELRDIQKFYVDSSSILRAHLNPGPPGVELSDEARQSLQQIKTALYGQSQPAPEIGREPFELVQHFHGFHSRYNLQGMSTNLADLCERQLAAPEAVYLRTSRELTAQLYKMQKEGRILPAPLLNILERLESVADMQASAEAPVILPPLLLLRKLSIELEQALAIENVPDPATPEEAELLLQRSKACIARLKKLEHSVTPESAATITEGTQHLLNILRGSTTEQAALVETMNKAAHIQASLDHTLAHLEATAEKIAQLSHEGTLLTNGLSQRYQEQLAALLAELTETDRELETIGEHWDAVASIAALTDPQPRQLISQAEVESERDRIRELAEQIRQLQRTAPSVEQKAIREGLDQLEDTLLNLSRGCSDTDTERSALTKIGKEAYLRRQLRKLSVSKEQRDTLMGFAPWKALQDLLSSRHATADLILTTYDAVVAQWFTDPMILSAFSSRSHAAFGSRLQRIKTQIATIESPTHLADVSKAREDLKKLMSKKVGPPDLRKQLLKILADSKFLTARQIGSALLNLAQYRKSFDAAWSDQFHQLVSQQRALVGSATAVEQHATSLAGQLRQSWAAIAPEADMAGVTIVGHGNSILRLILDRMDTVSATSEEAFRLLPPPVRYEDEKWIAQKPLHPHLQTILNDLVTKTLPHLELPGVGGPCPKGEDPDAYSLRQIRKVLELCTEGGVSVYGQQRLKPVLQILGDQTLLRSVFDLGVTLFAQHRRGTLPIIEDGYIYEPAAGTDELDVEAEDAGQDAAVPAESAQLPSAVDDVVGSGELNEARPSLPEEAENSASVAGQAAVVESDASSVDEPDAAAGSDADSVASEAAGIGRF